MSQVLNSYTNTIDPIYYFAFDLSPSAFEELKECKDFSEYNNAQGVGLFDNLFFPEEWKARYKNTQFKTYRFESEEHTFYYLLYSKEENCGVYAVITT